MKSPKLPGGFALRRTNILIALSYIGIAAYGQAIAQTQASTSFSYDLAGNLTGIQKAGGRARNFTYDELNRTSSETVVMPSTTLLTSLTYDGIDQIRSVTDPRSLVTTYVLDGLGSKTSQNSPDTSAWTFSVDSAGNRTFVQDARGNTTTYGYDAIGRLTSEIYQSGTATFYEYDGGIGGNSAEIGNLTKVISEAGTLEYVHDGHRRTIRKTERIAAQNLNVIQSISYTYGTDGVNTGKLTCMVYPSGTAVKYTYGDDGRISSMFLIRSASPGCTNDAMAVPLISNVQHFPDGQVKSWAWGDGTSGSKFSRTLDLDGRVASYSIDMQGTLRTLSFDDAGNITSYAHSGSANASQFDQNFTYDAADRLTGFTVQGVPTQIGYDSNGNRTSLDSPTWSSTYAYGSNSNRLASVSGSGARSFSYDANGNQTGDGTYTFGYSARNRLASVNGTVSVALYYNGLGQRVVKVGPGGALTYAYDEEGKPIGLYNVASGRVNEVAFMDGLPVATWTSLDSFNVVPDHLGAPVTVSNATGSIVWDWRHRDPFGAAAPLENSQALAGFDWRLPGQIADNEVKLNYNYYRDYDPQTGRYIESDPIGLEAGVNTYAYVSGNPVLGTDPLGLARQLDPKGQECTALREKIARKKQDINKRIQECKSNPQNLPYYPPYPGAPPRMSVQGHEDLIQDLKDTTADDEALYAQKCGGGSGGSPALNSVPQNSASSAANAGKATAAVAGMGVTYWIISEGLRVVFPPRNLVPVP